MLTRNLDQAREAYKRRDPEATRRAHSPSPPHQAEEKHTTAQGKYLKSIIYGGLDGTITTFAAAAGIAGASLSPGIVLIVGLANLLADGLSMSIGDYLSSKSEAEYQAAERAREKWEVENYPEGEKLELEEIYMDRGMSKEDAKAAVEIIAKDKKAWVDTMMIEELGIIPSDESPFANAISTFISFALFGFIPIAGYVLALFIPSLDSIRFQLACVLTGITLFTLGALKTILTGKNWFKSGLEMLLVGGVAASAAYLVGLLLGGLA